MSTLISIDTHTHTEHSSSVINISALLMDDSIIILQQQQQPPPPPPPPPLPIMVRSFVFMLVMLMITIGGRRMEFNGQ